MTRKRTISTFLIVFILFISDVTATFKLKDICKPGTICYYFMDGIKKRIYGTHAGAAPHSVCLQEQIEECSCFEMLFLGGISF